MEDNSSSQEVSSQSDKKEETVRKPFILDLSKYTVESLSAGASRYEDKLALHNKKKSDYEKLCQLIEKNVALEEVKEQILICENLGIDFSESYLMKPQHPEKPQPYYLLKDYYHWKRKDALQWAATIGNIDYCRLLVKAGIRLPYPSYESALRLAYFGGFREITNFLLSSGFRVIHFLCNSLLG